MPIRAFFYHRTGACRICSQPLFRIIRNQGVTHTTLQAKSCAKGMLLLACRLGQVLQNVLHFEVATGDPHPFGNPEPKGGPLWIPRHSLSNGTHTEKLCSPMSDHFLYLVAFIADYSFIFFFMKSRTLLKHHFFPVANITPAMAVAITAPAMP